jgi:RND family efflux transporter MFP subunit
VTALVGFATIRAPFDGVVTKRWVDRGAVMRDAVHPLLTVMRTDIMRVIMDVPARDVRFLRSRESKDGGNPVTLHVPDLHDTRPDLDFKGTVTLTAAALDPVTRTMRTEMHLLNPDGYLRPQMTGTATVTLAEHKGITVPATALVRRGERTLIYYISNPTGEPLRGIVRPLDVQLGLDDGVNVEIVQPRLTGRELIIRMGNGVIREGAHTVAVPARLEELQ